MILKLILVIQISKIILIIKEMIILVLFQLQIQIKIIKNLKVKKKILMMKLYLKNFLFYHLLNQNMQKEKQLIKKL